MRQDRGFSSTACFVGGASPLSSTFDLPVPCRWEFRGNMRPGEQEGRPRKEPHGQANMQRRTLADSAQVGLTRLKRDLKNLGMTEAQVHEIIPDDQSAPSATAPAPQPAPSA